MRGLLLDRGIAFAKSITWAWRRIPDILARAGSGLSAMARETIAELWDFFCDLDRRIATFDKKIEAVFKASEPCQRVARIKGVGPKTATATVAAVGDASDFRNGRPMAAWLGLVPRQFSSGDKTVLMGISQQGSQHRRSLLVHDVRAVVRAATNKNDPLSHWANQPRSDAVARKADAIRYTAQLCGKSIGR